MILRSIAVEGWKSFANRMEVGTFGDGLNVLHGPNGAGKSTLLWAMARGLFDTHTVSGEAVESLGGRATPAIHREILPEGRGYLLVRSHLRLVQFAYPDPASFERVRLRWEGELQAEWLHPARAEEVLRVEKASGPTRSSESYANYFDVPMDELTEEYKRIKASRKTT